MDLHCVLLIKYRERLNKFELYNLRTDPGETQNISTENPRLFTTMKEEFLSWNQSVDSSFAGLDYKEKKVLKTQNLITGILITDMNHFLRNGLNVLNIETKY